tara:strand:+ start:1215 stop:1922 length:708 start_codon:yes stop_codon:yes gene_type:complete
MKKKLKLPNITLLAASSIKIDLVQDALKISSYEIDFGAIKLISSSKPKIKFPEIEYIDIPEMDLDGYCKFLVDDLYKYFDTTHCLLIQEDSFVVNPEMWSDNFLNFDYIGAPWTKTVSPKKNLNIKLLNNRVGNGGFSLRSKKFALVCKDLNFSDLKFKFSINNEDIIICHYLYDYMKSKGIKFAPIKLASNFSMEDEKTNNQYGYDINKVFGFHGKHLAGFFKERFNKKKLIDT